MDIYNNYFKRYFSYHPFIKTNPQGNTKVIVVIPCYRDIAVSETIDSLLKNQFVSFSVEIIVVVNYRKSDSDVVKNENSEIYNRLLSKQKAVEEQYKHFRLLPILLKDVEKKYAGVGNARKAGMDEALRRFSKTKNKDGIIASLDADCIVADDYLQKIYHAFNDSKTGACTIGFIHDYNPQKYPESIIEAAKKYEIYLRYFKNGLAVCGYPYAIQTIGSCFAVRASVYAKSGGMSRKQHAGEDFYFLHKVSFITKISELNEILVFPSPRVSDRVPFGTGPAVRNIINQKEYLIYNFKAFIELKKFFGLFDEFYNSEKANYLETLPPIIVEYEGLKNINEVIIECKKNSNSLESFKKRMLNNYNAFFIVKILNEISSSKAYARTNVIDAACKLLDFYNIKTESKSTDAVLGKLIELDYGINSNSLNL